MRLLICHKGAKRKGQSKPSYSAHGQVRSLVRYCLRPAKASQRRERVVGIIDGLGMGGPAGGIYLPSSAELIAAQLCDDVPTGRRKLRHVLLCFSGDMPVEEQIKKCEEATRLYVDKHAPGHDFFAVIHGDHLGEDGRGLHVHLLIRNSDPSGRALDWSRDDLGRQQDMVWASPLGIKPTKGTGVPRPKGGELPYPKAENLDARKIGELTYGEIEQLVKAKRLAAGRRNKSGELTSVILAGRRIRISTARALVERERRLADLRSPGSTPDRSSQGHSVVYGVGIKASQPEVKHAAGRGDPTRPGGFGFGFGPSAVAGASRRKRQRRRSAFRSAGRLVKGVLSNVIVADKIGRVL
jgi:hypothetical protein